MEAQLEILKSLSLKLHYFSRLIIYILMIIKSRILKKELNIEESELNEMCFHVKKISSEKVKYDKYYFLLNNF